MTTWFVCSAVKPTRGIWKMPGWPVGNGDTFSVGATVVWTVGLGDPIGVTGLVAVAVGAGVALTVAEPRRVLRARTGPAADSGVNPAAVLSIKATEPRVMVQWTITFWLLMTGLPVIWRGSSQRLPDCFAVRALVRQ